MKTSTFRAPAILGFMAVFAVLPCCDEQEKAQSPVFTVVGTVCTVATGYGYEIIADSGAIYEPVNLASSFQVNGTRVRVESRKRPDLLSLHMWGEIIEILTIQPE